MRSLLYRLIRSAIGRSWGIERVESLIVTVARLLEIDLVVTGYRSVGILNYENSNRTGETFLIETILPRTISDGKAVILDVGANIGEIAALLRRAFPSARILACEPNPVTYKSLAEYVSGLDIECLNAGLGSSDGTGVLHCYAGDQASGHASVYRDMFHIYEGYGVPGAHELVAFDITVRTIDTICQEFAIDRIDFLKIDVEGHEFEVLKGARGMLERQRISSIQFEFTDCNVLSRTFMRDFYELLSGFAFFRLASDRLIPLGKYAARHEIFQFQNILAVKNDVLSRHAWQEFAGGKAMPGAPAPGPANQ